MKRMFAVLFISGTFLLAADANLSGTWKVKTSVAGTEGEPVCTFKQTESTLSGTCKGDDGSHDITGSVEGKIVSWQYKAEYNGEPLTVIFKGQIDSDSALSGMIDVQPFSVQGEFSAVKSK